MRKAAILLFVASLLLGSTVFAQGTGSNMFAGVSVGYKSNLGLGYFFPIGVHFGINNVGIQNLTVRGDAAYLVPQYFPFVRLGVDALYNYPVMTDLSVYGGLGPSALIGVGGLASGLYFFGLRISGGAEYMVTPHIGVTAEANATPYFNGTSPFIFGFDLGANYHF